MKKSTLYYSRKNYQIKSKKQYLRRLKHLIRYEQLSKNINVSKTFLNENIYFIDGEKVSLERLTVQELYDLLLTDLNNTIQNFKDIHHNTKEVQELRLKLKQSKKNVRTRLRGKDLDIEEFEKLDLSRESYINKNWTKEYKSIRMTESMKKRTLESLENYVKLKLDFETNRKDSEMKVSSFNTLFQEVVVKIPISNGVDFTNRELDNIIEKQIEIEKKKGNEVFFITKHLDESSNHIHFCIKNKDFKLVENQQKQTLKDFDLDYDLKNLTKEELIKIGELQQQTDLKMVNECMNQDIKFDLVHNVNENITNEERKLKNSIMKKENRENGINNRLWNNINLQLELNIKQRKEIIIKSLKLLKDETLLKIKNKTIDLTNNFKKISFKTNIIKNKNIKLNSNSKKDLEVVNELELTIENFQEYLDDDVLNKTEKVLKTDISKLKNPNELTKLRNENDMKKKRIFRSDEEFDLMLKNIEDKNPNKYSIDENNYSYKDDGYSFR